MSIVKEKQLQAYKLNDGIAAHISLRFGAVG